ncbi:site-specific integrase [Phaeobacter inhibens]|uniref:site-specific integrase n=1 Tax=Phaeobacter inhibens TaxID=221822 RepID=UPI0021A2AB9E|nr:site-specific integrase [Phaeobacter inhibens]UWS07062.1 site-specific integrase [Phaeobacter inhibens]
MKNFTRITTERHGYLVARLIDEEGGFLAPFDAFMDSLTSKGYSQCTVSRYGFSVANFLDFLTEAGVFGQAASQKEILEAVDQYIPIRLNAEEHIKTARRKGCSASRWDKLAHALQIGQLSKASLPNTLAAINSFLRLSEANHHLAVEEAQYRSGEVLANLSPSQLFQVSLRDLSTREQKALMRSSMLAAVVRLKPKGIKRPQGHIRYRSSGTNGARGDGRLDFPMAFLPELFQRASNQRDRAYWLLLAAGGLRSHEAEQLRIPDIDFQNRLVFVEDPDDLRHSSQLPDRYKLRFKGRTVSQVFLMQPFRDLFFEALECYWKFEYDPRAEHDFVFQDIRRGYDGRPFYCVSDQAKVKAFSKTCDAIELPRTAAGRRYGRHSLRHFYGVFMLNYLPLPDGFGLRIDEVQRLMGHKDQKTTLQYAREDKLILESKLSFADDAILSQAVSPDDLPRLIADRYEHEARLIRSAIK